MAQEAILTYLDKNEVIVDSWEFAVEAGLGHEEVINTIKSLKSSKYVDTQDIKKESCHLTTEGETYAANGSPEYQLFMAIPPEGITIFEFRFEEMPTNQYVVSSFENYDALFTAQQHPAHDLQDTFYLKVPSTTKTLPEDYIERVKTMHECGGH